MQSHKKYNPRQLTGVFLNYNIQSLITLWSLNSFPTTVLSIFLRSGFFNSSNGRGSFISSGDFPSISFTALSNRSLTSYTLPQTSGTPRSTPQSPYTASIAVRTEYSVVKIVSLGVSANWPKNAAFTQPSGITSGLLLHFLA